MASLPDIIAYLIREYRTLRDEDLSTARLTKMVYLADWRSAILHKQQITNIHWFFDHYGPFVWDVQDAAKGNSALFTIEEAQTVYGSPKRVFRIKDQSFSPAIADNEKQILDHVLRETYALDWIRFIQLVYSTYPIMSSERFTYLDLAAKAFSYEKSRKSH